MSDTRVITLTFADAPNKRLSAHDGPFEDRLSRWLSQALKSAGRGFGLRSVEAARVIDPNPKEVSVEHPVQDKPV